MDDGKLKRQCAIYSRVSVDEGDKVTFDSINAQFSACADYIGSQFGRGWVLVDTLYEDRGISGSHLDRPALRNLLKDIRYGLIDIVVIYKLNV